MSSTVSPSKPTGKFPASYTLRRDASAEEIVKLAEDIVARLKLANPAVLTKPFPLALCLVSYIRARHARIEFRPKGRRSFSVEFNGDYRDTRTLHNPVADVLAGAAA